jgi:hypothetical protein
MHTPSIEGFSHSAYAFGHEAHLFKSDLSKVHVAPGRLIQVLQKGLLYAEAEVHVLDVCIIFNFYNLMIKEWIYLNA